MKNNCFIKLFLMVIIIFTEIFRAEFAYSERYVTVATIGNTPDLIKNENKQEIVDYVIDFWEKELKKVLKAKPDLIVLPEFCDLSTAGIDYMKIRKGQVIRYFASVSRRNNCYIAFGMGRRDKKGYWRNSCVVLDRKGEIAGIYDKNFPTIAEMNAGIKPSNNVQVIECDFGRIGVAICFDLNFEELRDNYARLKPDIIIYPSMSHGGVLQEMWAHTCQSYFIGSIYRDFPSEIRNPLGDVIASTNIILDYAVSRINLDVKIVPVAYNYENLIALKSKYGRTVKISKHEKDGTVLITSENKSISAEGMLKEFNIELFDEYLDRARDIRMEDGNID